MTDEKRFKSACALNGLSMSDVAQKLGISNQSLYAKVNNKRTFSQNEIYSIMQILNLSVEESMRIFFTERVDE